MDGENHGKPYEQIDDLGVPLFLEHAPSSRGALDGSVTGCQFTMP